MRGSNLRQPAYWAATGRDGVSEAALRRLHWLSYLLDNAIALPGGYRIGLDGILGLIPGLGDSLGAVLSAYIIAEAARLGAPKATLVKMVSNIALDTVVGLVPVLGDVFDVAWKANARNVALLRAHVGGGAVRPRSSRGLLVLVLAALALVVLGTIALGYLVFKLIAALI